MFADTLSRLLSDHVDEIHLGEDILESYDENVELIFSSDILINR